MVSLRAHKSRAREGGGEGGNFLLSPAVTNGIASYIRRFFSFPVCDGAFHTYERMQ